MDELQFTVKRYLTSKISDQQLVADLTQETLLRLLAKKGEEIRNAEAWALRTARNLMIDHYRKVNKKHNDTLCHTEYDNLTDVLIKCQEVFLEELDEETRLLIEEVDIKGSSQKELAQKLNMSYPTLRSKLQRARKKIKKEFDTRCDLTYDTNGQVMSCCDQYHRPC